MIAVVDGGATKADWQIVANKESVKSFKTGGLSPFFLSKEAIEQEIVAAFPAEIEKSKIDSIYFFGSGCSSPERIAIVEQSLQAVFKKADIHVSNDMHGAALALYGKSSGIAAILGTGMNSCYWNGTSIELNPPSLGYILGDEGSGAHLGTTLIKAYLNKELPHDVYQLFAMEYPNLSRTMILDAVYRQPRPNAYLAQYAEFFGKHKEHPFVLNMITASFDLFFQKQISKHYTQTPRRMRCIGSVAYYLQNELRDVAMKHSVTLDLVLKAPIDNLAKAVVEVLR